MTTIRILPEILSNQIAAGEVVQRPASVVKELVENSIDANASQITIEIVKGGKSLIRVSDNGIGLSRDDALLSVERYATSKIFNKQDLFSISTMGFRGEALPSIASVSKFTLTTRTKASNTGTKIEIMGGRMRDVSDTGAPVGTMVEVKQLFFNTPARKKFLKSDNTEISHVADTISGLALGNAHIQFRLFFNGRLQKNFSGSQDLFQRSVHVLGRDTAGKLYPIEFEDASVRISGYCTNPLVTRSTSSKIFLFVNNRLVYDRGLMSAIFQGYKGRIMKGRFPLGVLFISVAYDQVDVNVHPSKKENKFYNGQAVYQAVAKAVSRSLLAAQESALGYAAVSASPNRQPEKIDDPVISYHEKTEPPPKSPYQPQPGKGYAAEQSTINWQEMSGKQSIDITPGGNRQKNREDKQIFKQDVKILGQVMGTYILLGSRQGMILVDQHAAHERIVYETLKQRYRNLKVQIQNLVVPETIELNNREADFLLTICDELKSLGFDIAPFGGNTFVIKSVPAIIEKKEATPVIIDIIEAAMVKKNRFSKEDWLEESIILMACHGAIRANLSLKTREIEKLIMDLEKCENPFHCPHGRPVMIHWNKHQIEKLFKRVV